jgi:hypothetical protein
MLERKNKVEVLRVKDIHKHWLSYFPSKTDVENAVNDALFEGIICL